MKIDISNDSFKPEHDYTRVLLQQGRPILDRDWNEQTSIVWDQFRAVARGIYGRHGGPAGGECGFVPTVTGKELFLQCGWYSIDGLIVHCRANAAASREKPAPVSYFKQRYCEPGAFAQPGTYLIYLEAIEREVTAAQDSSLLDLALPGVDVAARGQVIWRVRHDAWPDMAGLSARERIEKANEWYKEVNAANPFPDPLLPQGEVARDLVGKAGKNPNQLFRLEYRYDDVWRFSTNNGFALFQIETLGAAGQSKELEITGGTLDAWLPKKGDVIELLTMEGLHFGEKKEVVGEVVKAAQNDPTEPNRWTLELKDPVTAGEFKFLRVWNETVNLAKPVGVMPGDYWQFMSREGALDIASSGLRRPSRVYAPLALINVADDETPSILNRFQRIVGPQWREVDEVLDL